MKRTVLLKALVIAAPLICESSATDAYILMYSHLTCTYTAPKVLKLGHIPVVTIRNIGLKFIPAKTQYAVKFANTGATIHLTLTRALAPKQRASVPVQLVQGATSQCTATAALRVPISGGGPQKF